MRDGQLLARHQHWRSKDALGIIVARDRIMMLGTYHPCIGNGAIERLPIALNESGGGETITVEKQDPLPTGLARSKIASRCCSWLGTHEHTDRQIPTQIRRNR